MTYDYDDYWKAAVDWEDFCRRGERFYFETAEEYYSLTAYMKRSLQDWAALQDGR